MKSFWAIVKLTFRNAFRSHIFQLLLLLLLLAVIIVPSTVSGDGTAGGFIQVSLLYSLSAVSWILALSSIWLGCHAMTQDIDSYQLHMVVTKPVSRIRIWLAKWAGVYLVHLVLLLVATTAIYFIILYKYNEQDFPPEEREKIRNEVMVGRRVFWPQRVDLEKESQELVKAKIERFRVRGQDVDTSPAAQEKMFKEARLEIMRRDAEVEFNSPKEFVFTGIPHDLKKPLFLRYRPYVGKMSSEGQRVTATGTAFGVYAYLGENLRTVLREGGVRVQANGGQAVDLSPGEQLLIRTDGAMVVSRVDVDAYCSWMQGVYSFDGVNLHDVFRTLSRWYDIRRVDFDINVPVERCFSGRLRKSDGLETIMVVIERGSGCDIDFHDGVVSVRLAGILSTRPFTSGKVCT